MKRYTRLAYENANDLVYGCAWHSLRPRSGMVLGGGTVYPELNFTLPTMTIEAATMPDIRRNCLSPSF